MSLSGIRPSRTTDHGLQKLISYLEVLASTLVYDIALTRDLPPVERAARITVPTQIIVGEKNPVSIHEVGSQLSKAIPSAKYVQLAGENHMANAKKVLLLLSGFFKS